MVSINPINFLSRSRFLLQNKPVGSAPKTKEMIASEFFKTDRLTDFSFNIPSISRIGQNPDGTQIKQSSGISRLIAQTLNVYPFMINAKVPTIIDMVG